MAFHKAKALQEAEKSVAQGKISQAIKQYQEILENDPSDVSILNTVGDLYIRERNTTEGLKQFHKLAEAYVHEGFNVKAIAIYKKIAKVDPNSVENLLKLAELYQLQGLSREARDQYLQAAEFYKKRNQTDRALEVYRKLLQLDPDNINFHNRVATELEQAGKREEAAKTYLECAEILLHRGDQTGAEAPLKKAADLNPRDSKIQILRARVAISRQQLDEAEKIIKSSAELQEQPEGKRILLEAYLGARKLPQAQKLVMEVYHSNPTDFAPVARFSALLAEKGDLDGAYQFLAGLSDEAIAQNHAAALLDALRQICTNSSEHIPTLELMHRICEQTANELTLPEVLEALGRAHEHAGDLDKAEMAYQKLTEREPENETYHGLLKLIHQKQGKAEVAPVAFTAQATPLTVEDTTAKHAAVDVNQDAMLKEAFENSDLFARYNLTEKAIAELEKVLQVYPDLVEVHQRILEISRKGFPERGQAAATQLARIYSERGDHETASKYQAIATAKAGMPEIPLPPPAAAKKEQVAAPPPSPLPAPPVAVASEPATGMEFPLVPVAQEEPVAAAAPPEAVSFDLTPSGAQVEPPKSPLPPPPSPPAAAPSMELDLSNDFESMAAMGFTSPAPQASEPPAPPPAEIAEVVEEAALPPLDAPIVEEPAPPVEAPTRVSEPAEQGKEAAPADLEDSRIEVEFYLENGFVEEAAKTVATLEEKFPNHSMVAELRKKLNAHATAGQVAAPPLPAPPTIEEAVFKAPEEVKASDEAPVAETPADIFEEEVAPFPAPVPEPEPVANETAPEEVELPTSFATAPKPEPVAETAPEPLPSVPEPVVEEPVVAAAGPGMDMLGDLAGDLASSLGDLAPDAEAIQEPPPLPPVAAAPHAAAHTHGAAGLGDLLSEMEEPGAAKADHDDRETHYNLGVAFREMGLLDEAIGEFQKVVKGAGKDEFPPNYLQACSLLAICFMEKKMPAIAVKWYARALEAPGLEEEALMALQYDLGVAYELAGDSRNALERFTEVYSQNIDFRDVAEKIRELQQKA